MSCQGERKTARDVLSHICYSIIFDNIYFICCIINFTSGFSNQIPADFTFQLEVYSHILQDDMSIASTPRKIKKTIHSSISRTVGKKLAASLRDELNSGKM